MNRKTAKNLVEFMYKSLAPSMRFKFTGGEPLLNFPTIKYIIKYVSELNEKYKRDISFAIVTNATMLNDKIVKFFKKYKAG